MNIEQEVSNNEVEI